MKTNKTTTAARPSNWVKIIPTLEDRNLEVKELHKEITRLKEMIKQLIGELNCYDQSKETPLVIEKAQRLINQ